MLQITDPPVEDRFAPPSLTLPMSAPIVGVRRPSAGALALGPAERFAAGQRGYRLLGWFGLALALLATADMALAFFPAQWGLTAWRFTSVMQLSSSLPVLAVALGAITVAAHQEGGSLLPRLAGALNLALALATVAMLLIFVPAAGEALREATEATRLGIQKTVFRVGLYTVVFAALHLALALRSFRSAPAVSQAAA